MLAGYHTAGLLLHDPVIAIEELAHLGYRCVAIRPHAAALHPKHPLFSIQSLRIQDVLERTSMKLVLDIDGAFVEHPFRSRASTLTDTEDAAAERAREWIQQWAVVAREWSAMPCLTFSSGPARPYALEEENLEHLSTQLHSLCELVAPDVHLAIRPRHLDLIDSVAKFERLLQWLDPSVFARLGLAADVGEMIAAGEIPIVDRLERNLDRLACVYLCDRRAEPVSQDSGRSRDIRIGHGEVAVDRIVQSLAKVGFTGPGIVRVEGFPELGLLPAQEAMGVFE
ncbi:hypothetical protein Pla22_02160 [Rubripirellula amarantea]|uniref:Xylose isomerase-like TIM barrel domain-containing protein n=1 Tax=Rubripirellula amarantea TaxID=2527999 RepID=A0A5C5WS36_9BACT|nr:hypothetical protein Pla22_02160 [Rubripirellula amarantea]